MALGIGIAMLAVIAAAVRVQHPKVVLRVLIIILGHNGITGSRCLTGQSLIFINDLLCISPDFDIGSITVKTL